MLKIINLYVTASDTSRQYVGLYLKIIVDKNLYPEEQSPQKIDLFQVRGLEEKQVRYLTKFLQNLCDDLGPVLYTLMDACREYLTEHNYPTCPCSICQYHIGTSIYYIVTKIKAFSMTVDIFWYLQFPYISFPKIMPNFFRLRIMSFHKVSTQNAIICLEFIFKPKI